MTITKRKNIELWTLKIPKVDLKKNLAKSFEDVFKDYELELEGDRDNMQADFNRMTDCMAQIDRYKAASVFEDGYTMMLLNSMDFDFVDEFFKENKDNDNRLEVHIMDVVDSNGTVEVVEVIPHEKLSY